MVVRESSDEKSILGSCVRGDIPKHTDLPPSTSHRDPYSGPNSKSSGGSETLNPKLYFCVPTLPWPPVLALPGMA